MRYWHKAGGETVSSKGHPTTVWSQLHWDRTGDTFRPVNSMTNTTFPDLTMLAGQPAPAALLSRLPSPGIAIACRCVWLFTEGASDRTQALPPLFVRQTLYQRSWLPSIKSRVFKAEQKERVLAVKFLKACTTVHLQQSWRVSSEIYHLPRPLQAWLDTLSHNKGSILSHGRHGLSQSRLLLHASFRLTPFGATW